MEDPIWKIIIKRTGSVGAICFVFYFFIVILFKKEVYDLLGSERIFILTLSIIGVLLVALLSALKYQQNKPAEKIRPVKSSVVIYKNSSTHNGDNRF
jgi:uncharacterized membrane protein